MRSNYPRSLILFLITLCIALSFVATSVAAGPDPKKVSAVLKVGGGTVGGVGYVVMIGMSKIVKDAYPRIDMTVVPGGYIGNITRTESKELDIASTCVSASKLAIALKPPFEKQLNNVRSLYCTQDLLYYAAFVRKDFPVDTVEEMFQKKIPARLCTLAIGNIGELMWREFFSQYKTTWDDVAKKWGGKMNFVAWADAVNLVKDGHADGILSVGTVKIGWALELSSARPMKILKFNNAELDYMTKTLGFGRGVIPANTYAGITEDVLCPTDPGTVIVHNDVPDDVVEAILTSLWEGASKYAEHHALLAGFKAGGMCTNLPFPLHRAAEKFYKEKGCLK